MAPIDIRRRRQCGGAPQLRETHPTGRLADRTTDRTPTWKQHVCIITRGGDSSCHRDPGLERLWGVMMTLVDPDTSLAGVYREQYRPLVRLASILVDDV